MNFFLDSTVFQDGKDVFLNNKLSKEFLNICKQQKFSIYISSVVIDEIRRQYNTFINNQINNIKAGIGALNTIPGIHNIYITIPDIKKAMSSFDSYFTDLHDKGIIHIVPYSNDFLPELVYRSIHRVKPFTEAKQEFRDAIIWFSYAKIAEELQLENCYLISGNTKDYLNKQGQLFDELAEKSSRFTFHKDVYSVLNAPFMDPFKATHAMLTSLKEKEWDLDVFLNFLKHETTKNTLQKYLMDDLENISAKRLWSDICFSKSFISILITEISDITRPSIRGVDFINNEFVVNGSFDVKVQFISAQENEKLDIKLSDINETELIIFFDAIYDPESNLFKNLEISSYEDAYEYWEGVHRIGQDRF